MAYVFFVHFYRNGGREGYGKNNHERTGNGHADGYLSPESLRACKAAGIPEHPHRYKNPYPD